MAFRCREGTLVPFSLTAFGQHYEEGGTYRLAPIEEASPRSRSHYFACLNEAWKNLSDKHAERFPSVEALRKFALIQTGYRTAVYRILDTAEDATKAAAMLGQFVDPHSILVQRENTVTVLSARSQSGQSMSKKEFDASKNAVLEYLAQMIGVDQPTLETNAGRAA